MQSKYIYIEDGERFREHACFASITNEKYQTGFHIPICVPSDVFNRYMDFVEKVVPDTLSWEITERDKFPYKTCKFKTKYKVTGRAYGCKLLPVTFARYIGEFPKVLKEVFTAENELLTIDELWTKFIEAHFSKKAIGYNLWGHGLVNNSDHFKEKVVDFAEFSARLKESKAYVREYLIKE